MRVELTQRSQAAVNEELVKRATDTIGEAVRAAIDRESRGLDAEAAWGRVQTAVQRLFALGVVLGVGAVNARVGQPMPAPRSPGTASFAAVDVSGQLADLGFAEAAGAFESLIPGVEELLAQASDTAAGVADEVSSGVRADARASIQRVRTRLGADATPAQIAAAAAPDPRAQVETIIRTTTQRAFNEGSRQQLSANTDTIPVYRLDEIRDLRTRGNPRGTNPEGGFHWQMDGFVAYADDPVWNRIWAPNGWNCRAIVVGLTIAQAARKGYMERDGTITPENRARVEAETRTQRAIIDRGDYPDPGFTGI